MVAGTNSTRGERRAPPPVGPSSNATICKGFPELAAEAMVRAYIEDVFNRISIALGSKLKRRLASGR